MRTAYLQSASSVWVRTRRTLLLLCAAASLLFSVLSGRWLLGEAYATYARESLGRLGGGAAALASADLAVRLDPRNATYLSLLGQAERRHGDRRKAERLYQSALQQAPASALIWRDYALFRVGTRQFDRQLEHAVARVQALSPANRGMELGLAITGLSVWDKSSPALRELWTRSIVSRARRQPKQFLRYVFAAGSEDTLCAHFANNKALKDWCYWARRARRSCYQAGMPAKQVQACEKLGAYLGRAP